MSRTVQIIKDFTLSDNTVVEITKGTFTEWAVVRGIHIEQRENNFARKLYPGEIVTCSWASGTYCTTKEDAMRIGIEREGDAIRYLEEMYAQELSVEEDD